MRELNILFLGAGRRKSLMRRFLKASEREHVKLNLFSYEASNDVPVADIATIIRGRMWEDVDIESDILEAVRCHKIGVVIPCMDGAVELLAGMAGALSMEQCWACVSPQCVVVGIRDKDTSATWMEKMCGVLVPPHTYLQPPTPLRYPVIIKPRRGWGGRGQHVVYSDDHFKAVASNLDMNRFVVQQFIEGDEFSIDCYVARDGRVLGVVPRRRLAVSGGEVIKSVTVRDKALISECEAILRAAKFTGPITIQCIRSNHDARDYFTEINPRFGGGVILSMEAGANYARLVIREALGQYVGPVRWIDGVLMTRSFEETFFDASPRPASRPVEEYKLRKRP